MPSDRAIRPRKIAPWGSRSGMLIWKERTTVIAAKTATTPQSRNNHAAEASASGSVVCAASGSGPGWSGAVYSGELLWLGRSGGIGTATTRSQVLLRTARGPRAVGQPGAEGTGVTTLQL